MGPATATVCGERASALTRRVTACRPRRPAAALVPGRSRTKIVFGPEIGPVGIQDRPGDHPDGNHSAGAH